MVCSRPRWLLPVALFLPSAALQAQPAHRDPLDARAPVPAVVYRSSLAAAKPISAAVSWREANEQTARIGGWRVYAREAQQPVPAAAGAKQP